MPELTSLSTELLFMITTHLLHSPSSLPYHNTRQPLANLSQTCKLLHPIALETLFSSIRLPRRPWSYSSSLFLLIQTLLLHPERARLVTSLKMSIAYTIGESLQTPVALLKDSTATLAAVRAFVANVQWMSADEKAEFAYQVKGQRALAYCAMLLELLPNLRHLEFERDALPDDPFARMFWATSCTELKSLGGAVIRLGECAGLKGLRSWKGGVAGGLGLAQFYNVAALTTVDVSLRRMGVWDVEGYSPFEQVRTLRVDCGVKELSWDPEELHGIHFGLTMFSNGPRALSGLRGLHDGLAKLVGVFTDLTTVEFYADGEEDKRVGADEAKYRDLVHSIRSLAGNLKTLELPGGWWAEDTSARGIDDASRRLQTTSVADFTAFTSLETLVVRAPAIVAIAGHETLVANPSETLPSSIKHIIVHGAPDGIWSWVNDILDNGTCFPYLKVVEVRRKSVVVGKSGQELHVDLRTNHKMLWDKLKSSSIKVVVK